MNRESQLRLADIFPGLGERVRAMAAHLQSSGVAIAVVQGIRTWAEQDALYSKGRDADGHVIDKAAVVTNCRGGMSYHNFGLAVDCVPSVYGPSQPFDPDWNNSHPVWQKMIAAGEQVGLNSGATWRTFHDFPRFQLTGRFPEGEPSTELHELYRRGGLLAVWEEVAKTIDTGTKLCAGAQFSLAYESTRELDKIIHSANVPKLTEMLAKQQYWQPMRLDEIANQNVANKLFGMAVNMGVHQAAVYAQRAANGLIHSRVTPPSCSTLLFEDGMIGEKSLSAINALDPMAYYALLCDWCRQHYIHVASINPAQAANLQGWLKRAAA